MKRWLLVAGMAVAPPLVHAHNAVAVGCKSVQLVLDDRVTPGVLDRLWASGEAVEASPAVLQLRGCSGEVLDTVTLEAPLAKLDSTRLRGAPAVTALVTVDLTADAGTYSGPLTRPFAVNGDRLQHVQARAANGSQEPLVLALTGKAAWKKVRVGKTDHLLSVRSQLEDGQFMTSFRRYVPGPQGWRMRERSQPDLWESDGEFPSHRLFPSVPNNK